MNRNTTRPSECLDVAQRDAMIGIFDLGNGRQRGTWDPFGKQFLD